MTKSPLGLVSVIGISDFEFVSDFVLRISGFPIGWDHWYFGFRICFGFRASDFGFLHWAVPFVARRAIPC
jgi:hypothetical protein